MLERKHKLVWEENANMCCENNQKLNLSFHQSGFGLCVFLFCPEVQREECQLVDSFLTM